VGSRVDPHEDALGSSQTPVTDTPAARRLRVLVADDHRRIRAGIRLVLEAEPDFEIVGEADDGLQALQLARQHKPDILLLDQEMPGMRGIEVARALQTELPSVRVVMFTFDETVRSLAVASGVAAFLTKDASPGRLASTLRYVARVTSPAPAGVIAGPEARDRVVAAPASAERPRLSPSAEWSARIVLPTVLTAAFPAYMALRIAIGAPLGPIDIGVLIVLGAVLGAYFLRRSREVGRAAAERGMMSQELDQIARAVDLYAGPLELSDIADRLLGEMRSVVGPDATATLVLYDAALRTFEPIAEVGPNAGAFKRDVYPLVVLPHEMYERLVVQRRTWRLSDTEPPTETWRVLTNFFPRLQARAFCAIPLRSRGLNLGMVIVRDGRPAAIDGERLAQLERLSHFVASAVHTAALRLRSPEARPAAE